MHSSSIPIRKFRLTLPLSLQRSQVVSLSGLKLHHSLSPLLIQHPMSTLLAPNRVASLQWDFSIAVAAKIGDFWAFVQLSGGTKVVTAGGGLGWDLVGFA